MSSSQEVTIEDLYLVKEKAEIVKGEIIYLPQMGDDPGAAGDEIFVSLRQYAKKSETGRAVGDNKAFLVNLPHRKSFSPCAAFTIPQNTRKIETEETMIALQEATITDLYKTKQKAELVNGEIVLMPPTGDEPSQASFEIAVNLRDHTKKTKEGLAVPDNAAFRVNLPHRESLSPDAAYHTGKRTGMKFYEGAPRFAVEVRSENDYGPQAERAISAKRDDYFAAGTLVVWDVDLLSEDVVRVYRASEPENPTIYRRGEIAEAEPAVPGWSMAVDDLFPNQ